MRRFLSILFAVALIISLASCANTQQPQESVEQPIATSTTTSPTEEAPNTTSSVQKTQEQEVEAMQIRITTDEVEIVYQLNDSQAAKDLYAQLPMSVAVENFSNNEKIFYPATALDTSNAPMAQGGAGVLAYYAPWGDVVLFYDRFGTNESLYELGYAISGAEEISRLSGSITIEAVP